ncbi:MAG: hypothetical protein ACYC4Q_11390 [Victivallaceae bacterium]
MNRIRRIIITFLVVIAVAGIIHFDSKPTATKQTAVQAIEAAPSTTEPPELRPAAALSLKHEKLLTVCFFADKDRSNNESFIRELITQNFPEELKNGEISFKIISANDREYQQLSNEPKPTSPAIILEANFNGNPAERKNLAKLDFKSKTACAEYIIREIKNLLKK